MADQSDPISDGADVRCSGVQQSHNPFEVEPGVYSSPSGLSYPAIHASCLCSLIATKLNLQPLSYSTNSTFVGLVAWQFLGHLDFLCSDVVSHAYSRQFPSDPSTSKGDSGHSSKRNNSSTHSSSSSSSVTRKLCKFSFFRLPRQ